MKQVSITGGCMIEIRFKNGSTVNVGEDRSPLVGNLPDEELMSDFYAELDLAEAESELRIIRAECFRYREALETIAKMSGNKSNNIAAPATPTQAIWLEEIENIAREALNT